MHFSPHHLLHGCITSRSTRESQTSGRGAQLETCPAAREVHFLPCRYRSSCQERRDSLPDGSVDETREETNSRFTHKHHAYTLKNSSCHQLREPMCRLRKRVPSGISEIQTLKAPRTTTGKTTAGRFGLHATPPRGGTTAAPRNGGGAPGPPRPPPCPAPPEGAAATRGSPSRRWERARDSSAPTLGEARCWARCNMASSSSCPAGRGGRDQVSAGQQLADFPSLRRRRSHQPLAVSSWGRSFLLSYVRRVLGDCCGTVLVLGARLLLLSARVLYVPLQRHVPLELTCWYWWARGVVRLKALPPCPSLLGVTLLVSTMQCTCRNVETCCISAFTGR